MSATKLNDDLEKMMSNVDVKHALARELFKKELKRHYYDQIRKFKKRVSDERRKAEKLKKDVLVLQERRAKMQLAIQNIKARESLQKGSGPDDFLKLGVMSFERKLAEDTVHYQRLLNRVETFNDFFQKRKVNLIAADDDPPPKRQRVEKPDK